ncbi:MAG: condensation domain-containing protein [Polyangia bacterium]
MERALADMERAFYLLDCGTRFNGIQVVSIQGVIEEPLLRLSLDRLQARHPLLRVRLTGDDKTLGFTEDGAGPLPLLVLDRQGDDHWQAVVDIELNRPFVRTDDHLTRLLWLRGPKRSELVIAHHHVIADALSMVFAVRDLLTDLAALSSGQSLLPPESLPLRPPLPALLPAQSKGLRLFPAMHDFFFKHVLGKPLRRAKTLPVEQSVPAAQRQNRLVHRSLSGDLLRQLRDRAKAEQTTVHGALCAALLLATSAEVFADRLMAETPTNVGCFSAVNLRDKLRPSVGQEMGLYISQVTTFHQVVPPPSLWDLARESRQKLTETLDSGEQYLTMPLIGLFIPRLGNVAERFIRSFDAASPALAGVTNLQKLPIPLSYGPLTIVNFQIAVGLSVVGQLLLAVTTIGDTMNLNVVFVEPLVSRVRAERISDGLLQILTDGIRQAKAA